jgi:predicted kinase
MDLERLGHPALGDLLMGTYDELTAERHPASLLHHYVALRALVRAKVAFLRAEQGVATAGAEGQARLHQTRRRLERARVRLVLVGGAPGTGKSTVAEALGDRAGWVVLSSDRVRRTSGTGPVDYGVEAVERVYEELVGEAVSLLQRGETVVLDATWARAGHRALADEAARTGHADLVAVECRAPAAVCEERIRGRHPDHPSDATVDVARELRESADAWPEAVAVDTSGPVASALDALERIPALGLDH